jgi:hypothetical protein
MISGSFIYFEAAIGFFCQYKAMSKKDTQLLEKEGKLCGRNTVKHVNIVVWQRTFFTCAIGEKDKGVLRQAHALVQLCMDNVYSRLGVP